MLAYLSCVVFVLCLFILLARAVVCLLVHTFVVSLLLLQSTRILPLSLVVSPTPNREPGNLFS